MPHASMEYAIMVPILIVQVILLPMAAGWMISNWITRRRMTALQDVASHVGSTIQQLYVSSYDREVAAGTITQASTVPSFIESIPYTITASHKEVENSTMIDLYLALVGTDITTTARVTLGPNVLWNESTFLSNSTSAHIKVEKYSNGTLNFSFG